MTKLTHLSDDGEAHMVDVGAKNETHRVAEVAHDTSEINFAGRGARRQGLGPAGDGVSPGFFVHLNAVLKVTHI